MVPNSSLSSRSAFKKAYSACRSAYKTGFFHPLTEIEQKALEAFMLDDFSAISTDLLMAKKQGKDVSFWAERALNQKKEEQIKKQELSQILSVFVLGDSMDEPSPVRIQKAQEATKRLHLMLQDPYEGPVCRKLLESCQSKLP